MRSTKNNKHYNFKTGEKENKRKKTKRKKITAKQFPVGHIREPQKRLNQPNAAPGWPAKDTERDKPAVYGLAPLTAARPEFRLCVCMCVECAGHTDAFAS